MSSSFLTIPPITTPFGIVNSDIFLSANLVVVKFNLHYLTSSFPNMTSFLPLLTYCKIAEIVILPSLLIHLNLVF